MKLFYYCFAGSHSSVIAANIHLKKLPDNRLPSIKEIMEVEYFNQRDKNQCGQELYLGEDEQGHQIYVIGLGKDRELALQVIYHLLKERDNPSAWRFYDALSELHWLTKVGGFLSGNLKWVGPGKYLAAMGIRRCYPKLCRMVRRIKEGNAHLA